MFPRSFARPFALLAILVCGVGTAEHAQPKSIFGDASPTLVKGEFQLPDGAAWDGNSTLIIPDVKAKKLYSLNSNKQDASPNTLLSDSGAISGTCFQLGKLYLADNVGARLATLGDDKELVTLATFEANQRPNDLTVDVDGNVFLTFTGEGIVRRVSPSGEVSVCLEGLDSPNGIALSPDGQTLYVSSFKSGMIYQSRRDADNPFGPITQFAQLDDTNDGYRGDGMCVDRAGNVYCTGASSVTVFSQSGKRLDTLKMADRPINVIIGGADLRTMFISTFGGVYSIPVNAYGVSPNPSSLGSGAGQGSTSTAIDEDMTIDVNRVYAIDGDRKLLMDVIRKNSREAAPAIVLVHGGGWIKGDKTKFRPLAIHLARLGYVVASIEYRLAHEAKFPAGIRDCNAATCFIKAHADELGIDQTRIYAVGGSAGGHLAGLMATGSKVAELQHQHLAGECSVRAAVVMAGPMQIASGSVAERSHDGAQDSNAVAWLGTTINESKSVYELADAFEKIDSSTAPILFLTGSLDNPERNAPSRERLERAGVAYEFVTHEGAKHGHWNGADWIERVASDIDEFLTSH